jgi:hypothetical protein
VIAKAILDLFTLLPGATRSAAQTADQPLQAFSDSLLAATKSYSQSGSAVSANGKNVHGQSSISGSSNTSVAVLDDSDALPPIDLQPAQATGSTPTSFQARVVGPTISETGSTETTEQSGQIQAAVDPAASQSTSAQTGYAQSNIFASRLARAAGFQSRFTGTRTLRAGSATSQIVSAGVATRPFRNVTVTRLASSDSITAQSGAAQQAAVQPVFTLVQSPLASSETAQNPSTSEVSPVAQGLAAAEPAQTESIIPQSSAPSSIVPVQTPLATLASAQRASTGLAARLTQIASAIRLPAIRTIFAQASNVPVSVSQANVPHSPSAQSNLTAMPTSLVAASTSQTNSPVLASHPASNQEPVARIESGSVLTLASILSTSIPRQANVPSSAAPVQTLVASPAATQNDTTVVTGQPTLNVLPVQSTEEQSIAPQTSTLQAPVSQSNAVPTQVPVAAPVASQKAASAAASQPASNLPAVAWNETGSIFTLASILSTSIPRPVGIQSNVVPAQMPNAAPATSQNASTVAIGQPALNATVAGWNRAGTSFTPANIISTNTSGPDDLQDQTPVAAVAAAQNASPDAASQPTQHVTAAPPAAIQSIVRQTNTLQPSASGSNAAAAQISVAVPIATQVASPVAASLPARNAIPTGWNGSGSVSAPASILSMSIPETAYVPSNVSQSLTPFVAPAAFQNASTETVSQLVSKVPSGTWNESGSMFTVASIVSTSIPQPASVQSYAAPAQIIVAEAVPAQNASAVVSSPNTRNLPATGLAATGSTVPQANISHPAIDQSNFTPVQTLLTAPEAAQSLWTVVANQPVQNLPAVRMAETQSIIAKASAAPTSLPRTSTPQPAADPSDVARVETSFAGSSVAQNASAATTRQPSINVAETRSTGTPSIVPQAGTVTTNFYQASIAEPDAAPSSQSSIQKPTDDSVGTQFIPAVAASQQPSQTVLAVEQNQTVSTIAPSSTASTSIPSSPAVPSDLALVQAPLAESATAQTTATIATSQPFTQAVPTAGRYSSIAPASNLQTTFSQRDVAQSETSPAQAPLAAPAITQNTPAIATSEQPIEILPASRWNQTEPTITPVKITSTSIPQSAVVLSSATPVQTHLSASATTMKASAVLAAQPPALAAPAPQPNPMESSVAPVDVPQPVTAAATVQSTSKVVTGETTMNVAMTGSTGTQSIVPQASIVLPSTSEPATVESKITPVQIPGAGLARTQEASPVESSLMPAQTVPSAGWNEAEASAASINIVPAKAAQADIPQTAAAQSRIATAQASLVQPATTQDTSALSISQTSQDASGTKLERTPSGAAQPIIVSTSAFQPTVVQSNVIPAQTHSADAAATEGTALIASSEPVQNVKMKEPIEAHSSISPTNASQQNYSQKTVTEPPAVQSSVTRLGNDARPISASQPVAEGRDLSELVAVSAKSGDADMNAVAAAVSDVAPATSNSGVQDSPSPVAVNTNSNAVQSAVENVSAATTPAPVLREVVIASVKDVTAPVFKTGLTVQTDPQPAAANRNSVEKTITVPSGTADQLAALPQSASIGAIQTNTASLKPVSATKPQASASSASKGSSTDQTGAKKSDEPVSGTGTKTGSQNAASSGNQSQSGTASQAQIATPAPVDFTVHPAAAIAASQNTATVAANHTSSMPAEAAGVAAKTANNPTTQSSTTLPQAAPVINTARLIQNMGQSEMRVGMRSNEFGNISISTSATRDQVSAQISVEHGELAKTLTAHLPEMQARLGSSQPMDVRIDMNGAATGQGTGNFGGTSNDSASQSRSGRQQAGNMAAGQSGNSVAEQQFSPVVAAVPSGYARLDIRV